MAEFLNMAKHDLSRRRLIAAGAGLMSAGSLAAQNATSLTAGEVSPESKRTSAYRGWNKPWTT
jgi:hypothetical protein